MDFLVADFFIFSISLLFSQKVAYEGFDPFVLFSHSFIRLFLSGGGK